jgi:hypothetical protein
VNSPKYQCFLPLARGVGVLGRILRSAYGSIFFASLVLLVVCGCSTFNRDWKKAAQQPPPTNSIEGQWEGRWSSETNGHSGALRCLISLAGRDRCTARFRATYAKVLRFSYSVPLEIQPHYDGWEFDGEEDLGKLAGGVYYYEGRASPTNLFSIYRSKYDHGVFEMHRPE